MEAPESQPFLNITGSDGSSLLWREKGFESGLRL